MQFSVAIIATFVFGAIAFNQIPGVADVTGFLRIKSVKQIDVVRSNPWV